MIAWISPIIQMNENTIFLFSIYYFICIMIAGRRLYSETGTTFGYLMGFMGIWGVIFVFLFPRFFSNPFFLNRMGKYDTKEQFIENDLLKFAGVNDTPDKLSEIKQHRIGSGFIKSRVHLPVTGGFFLAMFVLSAFPVLSYFFKLLFLKSLPQSQSILVISQQIAGFLLYFIPTLMCITNHRTIIICPRCSQNHVIVSPLETFLGILADFEPSESGCKYCDYLPSRDRVITVE